MVTRVPLEALLVPLADKMSGTKSRGSRRTGKVVERRMWTKEDREDALDWGQSQLAVQSNMGVCWFAREEGGESERDFILRCKSYGAGRLTWKRLARSPYIVAYTLVAHAKQNGQVTDLLPLLGKEYYSFEFPNDRESVTEFIYRVKGHVLRTDVEPWGDATLSDSLSSSPEEGGGMGKTVDPACLQIPGECRRDGRTDWYEEAEWICWPDEGVDTSAG